MHARKLKPEECAKHVSAAFPSIEHFSELTFSQVPIWRSSPSQVRLHYALSRKRSINIEASEPATLRFAQSEPMPNPEAPTGERKFISTHAPLPPRKLGGPVGYRLEPWHASNIANRATRAAVSCKPSLPRPLDQGSSGIGNLLGAPETRGGIWTTARAQGEGSIKTRLPPENRTTACAPGCSRQSHRQGQYESKDSHPGGGHVPLVPGSKGNTVISMRVGDMQMAAERRRRRPGLGRRKKKKHLEGDALLLTAREFLITKVTTQNIATKATAPKRTKERYASPIRHVTPN